MIMTHEREWEVVEGVPYNRRRNVLATYSLLRPDLAERMCTLLNDLQFVQPERIRVEESCNEDKYRIACVFKILGKEANITFEEMGLSQEEIRNINKFYEEGLNERNNNRNQTGGARNDGSSS
jgi:hypothetical protein